MTDVLLGQGYYLRFDPKPWEAQQPYPPLGALYAAAVLRDAGHAVAVFDSMLAVSEREWDSALAASRPRIAVVYEDGFNYLSKMCLLRMREAALRMARMARERGARVVVAGPDASDHPEQYLAGGADYVVVGEGEQTLRELADALLRARPVEMPGLAYRNSAGDVVRTPPRALLKDLDALPRPAFDLVDLSRYRRTWQRHHGYFSLNLVTTRGCPYHCNWCAKPIYGQRYAVRSPESVVEEIAELKRLYAPDQLNFVDDIFGLQPGWVERFAALIGARSLQTPFKCLSRVDLLEPAVVDALRDAGCCSVWVGAESGSQRILDAMEKGTRVEQIREAARRLHSAGIEVGFFLQFGYPGETRQDVEATLQLVRDCRPDDIGISVSYPLPGTPFHARVVAQLGVKRNWDDSDDLAMMYRGPFDTGFYRALHRVAHKEFRIQRIRDEIAGARPGARGRSRARRLAALAYHSATLPFARARMERAARGGPSRPGLPFELAPERAARPSEQKP
jgi:anaerobic magnesium-protoporphyrin IX monomethyl ester cyclase